MENVSKALIISSTILLGIMILGFMIYMFKDASRINQRYDIRESEKVIQAFNARFLSYETVNDFIVDPGTGNLYRTEPNKRYAKFHASLELNKISDVITVINEAYDVNYTNNRGYKNELLEYTNAMIIVLDLRNDGLISDIAGNGNDSKSKYVIFPNKYIEPGYLYGVNESQFDFLMDRLEHNDRTINLSGFQKVECSKFMEFFRESRLATVADNPPDNRTYTFYKYYFSGKINLNETTGKVDKITFTLVEDRDY